MNRTILEIHSLQVILVLDQLHPSGRSMMICCSISSSIIEWNLNQSDLSTCDPVISCKTGGRTCTFITCPSSSSLIGGFTGMESSSPADFDLDAVDTASADTLNGTS
jgi:hypothetical protein